MTSFASEYAGTLRTLLPKLEPIQRRELRAKSEGIRTVIKTVWNWCLEHMSKERLQTIADSAVKSDSKLKKAIDEAIKEWDSLHRFGSKVKTIVGADLETIFKEWTDQFELARRNMDSYMLSSNYASTAQTQMDVSKGRVTDRCHLRY